MLPFYQMHRRTDYSKNNFSFWRPVEKLTILVTKTLTGLKLIPKEFILKSKLHFKKLDSN